MNSTITPLRRRLATLAELAAVTGLGPGRIRSLVAEGRIPRIELGWRTHRYDIDAVLEALREEFGTQGGLDPHTFG